MVPKWFSQVFLNCLKDMTQLYNQLHAVLPNVKTKFGLTMFSDGSAVHISASPSMIWGFCFPVVLRMKWFLSRAQLVSTCLSLALLLPGYWGSSSGGSESEAPTTFCVSASALTAADFFFFLLLCRNSPDSAGCTRLAALCPSQYVSTVPDKCTAYSMICPVTSLA